ncbi:MAG: endo alpha-1,4 polygalactosaminidase [Micromonosporaceae bacterium]|nr:endo alpha-1,4 polygalactosaminidase [Micromonosporaceae bacterium]
MTERTGLHRAMIISVALGVVLLGAAGTAAAGDRGRWGKRPKPGPVASASRTATAVPGASPTLTTLPASSPTASGSPAAPSRSAGASTSAAPGTLIPFPANAGFDYQIGQPYGVPAGVGAVSRDHGASPAPGVYNICYVNGFQAQPEELSNWKRTHDDLLLKRGGEYVVDGDWNEVLLDISTSAKRDALVTIVGAWIDECSAKGFDAVEVDNLDSWTRSGGTLTRAQAVAYATQLTGYAHSRGLAMGQKNTVEIAGIGKSQIGFDFAIAESCADYELTEGVMECQGFVDAYGSRVVVIEYDTTHFQQACRRYGSTLSIIQRDRDVTAPGSGTYVYQSC